MSKTIDISGLNILTINRQIDAINLAIIMMDNGTISEFSFEDESFETMDDMYTGLIDAKATLILLRDIANQPQDSQINETNSSINNP